ncbi:MAG TPA: type II toxin-antitoxin system RelE/ParE family toxin [Thermoanaerobaculia bacterium]
MKWDIRWMPRALKDARRLDPQVRARVVSAIERFASTGVGDVLRLEDVHPPELRLRVGDWRVRFQKDLSGPTLVILRVLPRDKVY